MWVNEDEPPTSQLLRDARAMCDSSLGSGRGSGAAAPSPSSASDSSPHSAPPEPAPATSFAEGLPARVRSTARKTSFLHRSLQGDLRLSHDKQPQRESDPDTGSRFSLGSYGRGSTGRRNLADVIGAVAAGQSIARKGSVDMSRRSAIQQRFNTAPHVGKAASLHYSAAKKVTIVNPSTSSRLSQLVPKLLELGSLTVIGLGMLMYSAWVTIFALLFFAAGEECFGLDALVSEFNFSEMLWLSVHTFSTVGYGSTFPVCASTQVRHARGLGVGAAVGDFIPPLLPPSHTFSSLLRCSSSSSPTSL